ncbi:hypothetical protein A2G94_00020 [Francisella endosymbiont of Ornithodoros moubata]|nr:hypothetical protein A2G94_00020 [Francisella endosymbiont of Ornithodoros moubata]
MKKIIAIVLVSCVSTYEPIPANNQSQQ